MSNLESIPKPADDTPPLGGSGQLLPDEEVQVVITGSEVGATEIDRMSDETKNLISICIRGLLAVGLVAENAARKLSEELATLQLRAEELRARVELHGTRSVQHQTEKSFADDTEKSLRLVNSLCKRLALELEKLEDLKSRSDELPENVANCLPPSLSTESMAQITALLSLVTKCSNPQAMAGLCDTLQKECDQDRIDQEVLISEQSQLKRLFEVLENRTRSQTDETRRIANRMVGNRWTRFLNRTPAGGKHAKPKELN